MMKLFNLLLFFLLVAFTMAAQPYSNTKNPVEVGETMEAYLRENHLENIENMVHHFVESRVFLDYLLDQGHRINPDSVRIRRRDVSIGKDVDVYVKHFTEHQNFTMIMVPVSIYPLMIYDTLLFSMIEVSDNWLQEKYYFHNLEDDSVKYTLLETVNHEMLTRHLFEQVLGQRHQENAEVEVKLHESYISTNTVSVSTQSVDSEEKNTLMHSWGTLKRIFSHNLEMNVEMNVYIFGFDDLQIGHYTDKGVVKYQVTPGNIFDRHRFIPD